jgi:fatty-acyl-CoA synthase
MTPFQIASIADVRDVEQGPYAAFMAHTTVHAALEQVAARYPRRTALTAIDDPASVVHVRQWTHEELLADVRRTANLFRALCSGRTPCIALLLPPIPEAHLALWGAETAGTVCPINFQLNTEHIAAIVRASGAEILVALGPAPDLDIWPRVDAILAECPGVQHVLAVPADPQDALPRQLQPEAAHASRQRGDALDFTPSPQTLAALFHTGGTTGAPKLTRHTHQNQLHAAWGAAQMFSTREQDVILNGFPLFHVAGAFVFGLSTLLAGGEVVLPTRLGLRHAGLMARLGKVIEQRGITLLAAVPTVIAGLLSLNLDNAPLRSVRALLTGGSPLPDELAARFEQRHHIPVRNILGMTESAGVISIEPLAGPRTPGSCGLPLPFTEVRVLRGDGTLAALGEPGIVRVRGPNVSPGYTEAARDAGTFEDGWLVSGDIGHVDAAGRLFITGRAKDVIIRGAHNIDPGLIESALLRHPDVLMAAAVGAPDAYAGELPVAFVSLKPGAQLSAETLAAFAAPHIAERPAVPKRIDIVPAIPMTAVGKVYKPALRVLATRRVIDELLASNGLTAQVQALVQESPGGLAIEFRLTQAGDDAAAEVRVRHMMAPFPLAFTVTGS